MFNNIDKKLKLVAKIYFWVMVAISVILAFTLGITSDPMYYRGHTSVNALLPCFLLVGPACAYVGSLLIYGFGQLIENTKVDKEEKVVEVKTVEVPKEEAKTVSEVKTETTTETINTSDTTSTN